LLDVVARFADPVRGHDLMVHLRWPGGVTCPRPGCGSSDVATIERRSKWRCRQCSRQFSVKVETLFEDSPIGFDKWLPTMWLIANTRTRLSSLELGRTLGVTQKTAWSMLHRLRLAVETEQFDRALAFEGEVPPETARAAASSWNYE
jgi:transposase-like protein